MKRIAIGIALALVLAALAAVILHRFLGLRAEVTGTGYVPLVSLYDEDRHLESLEAHRSSQAGATPAPATTLPAAEVAAPADRPVAVSAAAPAPWPRYRGPAMDGRYPGRILTVWPADGPPLLYKQPIGGGYSSFTVGGGLAYTLEQRGKEELVAAYEPRTGREVWTDRWSARFSEGMGGDGPRSTPAYEAGRVFALGAAGELRALDARTGGLLWRTNILEDAGVSNLQWGMASSPLPVDGLVVALPGGRGASVVAYDQASGEEAWRALDDRAAYTAPMAVELAGERQLLVVTAERALGLGHDGQGPLWEYPWTTEYDVNAAQPLLVTENRFFLSAGYGHGAALVEIVRTGKGLEAREVWSNTQMKNKLSSSVLFEGYLYGLDEGILACVDAATGERRWKRGRYGHGQLLLADGHLIVLSERGDLALVRANPERHEELALVSALRGKTWNNPALVDGVLLVRNTTEMAAFDVAR